MKRAFNYSECENIPKLFRLLNQQVEEGYIVYKIDEMDESIIIDNLLLDDDDDLFTTLSKMDLIEDYDNEDCDDVDDSYDDFYDNDVDDY